MGVKTVRMFTIEHEFDATVVTIIDDNAAPSHEDITIHLFEDVVTIEQADPRDGSVHKITFTMNQIADLRAALDLPEGAYVRKQP